MDDLLRIIKPLNDLMLKYPAIGIGAFLLFMVVAWWDKLRNRRKE